MNKLILLLLVVCGNLTASQPSNEDIQHRHIFMKNLMDNFDIYNMPIQTMIWVEGYCAGLEYSMDGTNTIIGSKIWPENVIKLNK